MDGVEAHCCSPSRNPRNINRCDCGLPVAPTMRPRNIEFERLAHEYAAKGVCDHEPLFDFCQRRAAADFGYGTNAGTVRIGPDWLKEFRAEAGDGANYLVWWLEENLGHPDRYLVETALRYIHAAYDSVGKVGN